MPDTPDAYKILQVDPEADPEVIQAAYRRLAQKYHPDLAGDSNSDAGREAMSRMVAINAAWAVLRDPVRRSEYDRERAAWAAARPDATSGAGSGPGRAAAGANRSTWSGRVSGAGGSQDDAGGVRGPGAAGSTSAGTGAQPAADSAPLNTGPADAQAGLPPGRPSGSVLNFGRYRGWSVGQIGHVDPEYLEWLLRAPIGRPYTEELDALIRKLGRAAEPDAAQKERRGLFRRR